MQVVNFSFSTEKSLESKNGLEMHTLDQTKSSEWITSVRQKVKTKEGGHWTLLLLFRVLWEKINSERLIG